MSRCEPVEPLPTSHTIKDGAIRKTEVDYSIFLYSKNTQLGLAETSICAGNSCAPFSAFDKKLSIVISKILLVQLRLVN